MTEEKTFISGIQIRRAFRNRVRAPGRVSLSWDAANLMDIFGYRVREMRSVSHMMRGVMKTAISSEGYRERRGDNERCENDPNMASTSKTGAESSDDPRRFDRAVRVRRYSSRKGSRFPVTRPFGSYLTVDNVIEEILDVIRLRRLTAISTSDAGGRGIVVEDILGRMIDRTMDK